MAWLKLVKNLKILPNYQLIPPNLPFPMGYVSLMRSPNVAGVLDQSPLPATIGNAAGENTASQEKDFILVGFTGSV